MVKYRSGDTVCSLHHAQKEEEHVFLGSASKSRLTASPSLTLKPMTMVPVVWPQNHLLRFPGLCLKIGSCDLVIWLTKSPRRFLDLGIKAK
jgi:hypothetical protein